ncbi:hypothetical protein KY321_01785 [Candidatus Woesearchaeota archaeon]|nr:hypothetical protein [Candidatus Woesearchaeota archaeon]
MAEVILTKKDFEELVKEKFQATDMRWEGDELIITVDVDELETHPEKEEKKENSEESMDYVDQDSMISNETEEVSENDGYKDLSVEEKTEGNSE